MKRFMVLTIFLLLANVISPMMITEPVRAESNESLNIQVLNATDLQAAINSVANDGTIQLAAGTYQAPANGFQVINQNKNFTIRAESPGNVVLDGGGSKPVFRLYNDSLSTNSILFEGIKFANGRSTTNGYAGGVSIERGGATFVNCVFENNRGDQNSAGGGGIFISQGSKVLIVDSTFTSNTARNYGGAIAVEFGSSAYIHNSSFTNNRTNLAGHRPYAAGGAIHVGNSILRVSNSSFQSNQAGYVGGAIYAIGEWNQSGSDVIVANSVFNNNVAQNDPSVPLGAPTEGGAIHAEDLTTARIYFSRFVNNRAMTGGGVNLYRAVVEINELVFLGNQATGPTSGNGFGGAISGISNDTGVDGGTNRRAANLTVRKTFIQGRYGATGSAARVGAGIYITGDGCRAYGGCGISTMDGGAANRASLTLDSVVLADLSANASSNSAGGAVFADLANVAINNSMLLKNEAVVNNSPHGGGLAAIRDSAVTITDTFFVNNYAAKVGGALSLYGSTLNVTNSRFILNSLGDSAYGTAVSSQPCNTNTCGININMTGSIQSSTFTGQTGTIINDEDTTSTPINDLRHNNNTYYVSSAGAKVYIDRFVSAGNLSVAELNAFVASRSGSSTDKGAGNSEQTGTPTLGRLLSVPSAVLQTSPPGETAPIPAYLSFGWSGASASLDGVNQSNRYGWSSSTTGGNHTLSVGGTNFNANLALAPVPAAMFQPGSAGNTLEWSLQSGSYLDGMIDRNIHLGVYPPASGSIAFGSPGRAYRYYAITQQGGVVAIIDTNTPRLSAPVSVFVLIGLNLPSRNISISIRNVGGQTMNWTASSGTPSLLKVLTSSGSTASSDVIKIEVLASSPGTYQGQINVNAGTAGSQTIAVTVLVVNKAVQTFLPVILR